MINKHFISKLLITAGIALSLAGCTQNKTESSSHAQSVISNESPDINVTDLYNKYSNDPDSDEPTYDGKQETATGVITYIGKDDHGTDSMQLSDKEDGTSYVLGVFGSADEMKSVSVGDTVTITGNFHIMSSSNMVVLKQCKIIRIY